MRAAVPPRSSGSPLLHQGDARRTKDRGCESVDIGKNGTVAGPGKHETCPQARHVEGSHRRAQNYGAIREIDWVIVAIVGLAAPAATGAGSSAPRFSLVGLVLGAIVGARVAPHFLAAGATRATRRSSGSAARSVGVGVFQLVARVLARTIRGGLHLLPPLRLLDSLGGLAVGALWGLALVWVVGAVALQIPGHPKVRREVRQSEVLQRLEPGRAAARRSEGAEAARLDRGRDRSPRTG